MRKLILLISFIFCISFVSPLYAELTENEKTVIHDVMWAMANEELDINGNYILTWEEFYTLAGKFKNDTAMWTKIKECAAKLSELSDIEQLELEEEKQKETEKDAKYEEIIAGSN